MSLPYIIAASLTVGHSGPTWDTVNANGEHPPLENLPYVALNPTIPQKAAGRRTEPPPSVPILPAHRPDKDREKESDISKEVAGAWSEVSK